MVIQFNVQYHDHLISAVMSVNQLQALNFNYNRSISSLTYEYKYNLLILTFTLLNLQILSAQYLVFPLFSLSLNHHSTCYF